MNFRIPLAAPTITPEDIEEAIDSLRALQLTMGKKTKLFEAAWAKYVGVKDSVLTNSGTSAEDLAFYTLREAGKLKPRDEVITSPVTFPSSVNAILHAGAVPVFIDVDLETLNFDERQIWEGVGEKTKAILPVHFMGNPCDMDQVMEAANEYKLSVIEDCAESHGAMVGDRKVGSFGDMGIFSFFFSHHISTIEGGSVVSDDDEYLMIARSLRSYGWIRALTDSQRESLAGRYSSIDPRHLYINTGYNFKPTEINAAIGLHQIERIESIIEAKRRNAQYLIKHLSQVPRFEEEFILPRERKGTRHSWLGFPLVAKRQSKFQVMGFLEKNGIDTRQLEAGNMLQQPSATKYEYREIGSLPNARLVMKGGLFFGNYHTMSNEDLDYVVGVFEDFIRRTLGSCR